MVVRQLQNLQIVDVLKNKHLTASLAKNVQMGIFKTQKIKRNVLRKLVLKKKSLDQDLSATIAKNAKRVSNQMINKLNALTFLLLHQKMIKKTTKKMTSQTISPMINQILKKMIKKMMIKRMTRRMTRKMIRRMTSQNQLIQNQTVTQTLILIATL